MKLLCNKSYLGCLPTNSIGLYSFSFRSRLFDFTQFICFPYRFIVMLPSLVGGAWEFQYRSKGMKQRERESERASKGNNKNQNDEGCVRTHIICGEKRWNQRNNLYCGLVFACISQTRRGKKMMIGLLHGSFFDMQHVIYPHTPICANIYCRVCESHTVTKSNAQMNNLKLHKMCATILNASGRDVHANHRGQ